MKQVIVGLFALLILVGCNTTPSSETTPTTEETTETTTQDSAMAENTDTMAEESMVEGDVQVIEVEGGSFYYKPNEIRVKKGQKVKIQLNSVDMMHDFVIDELNVRTEIIPEGETTSVEFTADQVGEFEFYCSVGQHRANGMVGTLIVEE